MPHPLGKEYARKNDKRIRRLINDLKEHGRNVDIERMRYVPPRCDCCGSSIKEGQDVVKHVKFVDEGNVRLTWSHTDHYGWTPLPQLVRFKQRKVQ